MELSNAQQAQFEHDGFLIFPELFAPAEIAVLRQEVARLSRINTDEVFREHTGGVGVDVAFRLRDYHVPRRLIVERLAGVRR